MKREFSTSPLVNSPQRGRKVSSIGVGPSPSPSPPPTESHSKIKPRSQSRSPPRTPPGRARRPNITTSTTGTSPPPQSISTQVYINI